MILFSVVMTTVLKLLICLGMDKKCYTALFYIPLLYCSHSEDQG